MAGFSLLFWLHFTHGSFTPAWPQASLSAVEKSAVWDGHPVSTSPCYFTSLPSCRHLTLSEYQAKIRASAWNSAWDVVSTLEKLTHLILTATLWGGYYYCHVPGSGHVLAQSPTASNQRSWGLLVEESEILSRVRIFFLHILHSFF